MSGAINEIVPRGVYEPGMMVVCHDGVRGKLVSDNHPVFCLQFAGVARTFDSTGHNSSTRRTPFDIKGELVSAAKKPSPPAVPNLARLRQLFEEATSLLDCEEGTELPAPSVNRPVDATLKILLGDVEMANRNLAAYLASKEVV